MPAGMTLRGGRGGLRRSDHRARVPAEGRARARVRRILDLRRVRSDRNGGGAAREALRRPRHRRLQHEERRARALARSRRGHRLPAGGLHEERQDLRRRLRRGRQALVQALPALAEAGRDLHRDRPRVHVARPAAGAPDPLDRRQEGHARRSRSTRRRTSSSSRSSSRRASTARSSTGATRWSTWSRRRSTSRPVRRRGTSS